MVTFSFQNVYIGGHCDVIFMFTSYLTFKEHSSSKVKNPDRVISTKSFVEGLLQVERHHLYKGLLHRKYHCVDRLLGEWMEKFQSVIFHMHLCFVLFTRHPDTRLQRMSYTKSDLHIICWVAEALDCLM